MRVDLVRALVRIFLSLVAVATLTAIVHRATVVVRGWDAIAEGR